MQPIFLNSGFRTASTWLWEKLRALPTTVAYYEYFHDALATLTRASAPTFTPHSWPSKHPRTGPYFIELLPLLNDDVGVRGYDRSMAFDRYLPVTGVEGEIGEAERAYVQALIDNAARQDKVAVLSETRTLGRGPALRRAFASRSVFLHRNLFHQWASYTRFAHAGSPFFLESIDRIARASRQDETMRLLDDFFADRTIVATDERLFALFLLSHLRLYAANIDACDLELDVSRLASSADARGKAEATIGAWAGSPIDLSDARLDFEFSLLQIRDRAAFLSTVDQLTKLIASKAATTRGRAFVEAQKEAAIEEWRRHEFYTGALRSVLMPKPVEPDRIEVPVTRLSFPEAYVQDGRNVLMESDTLIYDPARHGSIDAELLFFGPYQRLAPGRYEARFHGALAGETRTRLHHDAGRTVIAVASLTGFAHPIGFELAKEIRDFEILMFKGPKLGATTLSMITLRRVG